MKHAITTWNNSEQGSLELNDTVFAQPLRKDILQRVVEWQRARKQAGTHQTKTRAMVAHTTKKPFRQKGTGNARQGSLVGPHMVGGGRAHGPQVRSHAYSLPKNIRRLGLKVALSQKLASNQLLIVPGVSEIAAKTSDMRARLEALQVRSALVVDAGAVDQTFSRAVRNIPYIDVIPSYGLNVYDILRHQKLILTTEAVKALEARLV